MEDLKIRASPFGYVVAALIFGPIVGLMTANLLNGRAGLLPVLYALVPLLVAWLWISAFRIRLRNGRLEYRTLLTRHALPLTAIRSWRFETGFGTDAGRLDPFVRLMLRANEPLAPLVVNAKVFRRADLEALLMRLEATTPR